MVKICFATLGLGRGGGRSLLSRHVDRASGFLPMPSGAGELRLIVRWLGWSSMNGTVSYTL
eukprot:2089412-Amphidinium_carterae.1